MQLFFKNLQSSFKLLISGESWLDLTSKLLADLKLDSVRLNAGYPDWILDSQSLDEYYANLISAIVSSPDATWFTVLSLIKRFQAQKYWANLNSTVDRSAVFASALSVNAFYNPLNVMIIPLASMQSPVFR